jgi:hypothetical protein
MVNGQCVLRIKPVNQSTKYPIPPASLYLLMQNATTNDIASTLISFITSIGIPVWFEPIAETTFLPGLRIRDGGIYVDHDKLKYPGDLLHEAGHLAVIPPADRPLLNEDNIGLREHQAAEEMMTIAWTYAVCVHLGIDPHIVFHENGYKGDGANIADNFSEGRYFGVPVLQWIGMTIDPSGPQKPDDAVCYPQMIRWMRE